MALNKNPDWKLIQSEYLTGALTLRELGLKYGVSAPCICQYAKRHNWKKDSEEIERTVNERVKSAVINAKMSNNERALKVSNELLVKIEEAVKIAKPKDIGALKGLVASMKDLKEMGVYQLANSESDIKVEILGGDDYAD